MWKKKVTYPKVFFYHVVELWAGLDRPAQPQTNLVKTDLLNYAWQLKKDGKTDETIEPYVRRLRTLAKLCNINDPEQVKITLADLEWKNSTKTNGVIALKSYYQYKNIQWKPPHYPSEDTLPFIPLEAEIDALINDSFKTHAALLQLLKETAMRTAELMKLTWNDIDMERRLVTVHPAKGSNARILPISDKLINMLNQMPRKSEKVVTITKHGFRIHFETQRRRTAEKLGNPRLMQIHLHTFRHWKATQEYHKIGDIYHVMKFLGHKSIKNTQIYITVESLLWNDGNDEWTCKAAATPEEATKLIETGFQYVQTIDNVHLYRKRK